MRHAGSLLFLAFGIAGMPLGDNDEAEDGWKSFMEEMEKSMKEGYDEWAKEMDKEFERKKRADEPDPFDKWMEEMQAGFDKDFEEYMKEMEAEYGGTGARRRRQAMDGMEGDSPVKMMVVSTVGKSERNGPMETTTLDQLMIALEQDMNRDFEDFLQDLDEDKGSQTDARARYGEWKRIAKRDAMRSVDLLRYDGLREKRDEEDSRAITDIIPFYPKSDRSKKESSTAPCKPY